MTPHGRAVSLLALAVLPAFSQPDSIGIKAGVPLSRVIEQPAASYFLPTYFTDRYIAGVAGEFQPLSGSSAGAHRFRSE